MSESLKLEVLDTDLIDSLLSIYKEINIKHIYIKNPLEKKKLDPQYKENMNLLIEWNNLILDINSNISDYVCKLEEFKYKRVLSGNIEKSELCVSEDEYKNYVRYQEKIKEWEKYIYPNLIYNFMIKNSFEDYEQQHEQRFE